MATATTQEDIFLSTVARLNKASVVKRHEAHRDIDWDAEPIETGDPRFQLSTSNALGATTWYRALPEATRAALGLDWVCQTFRIGISFEACLSRGLLEFAGTLPNGSPLYRYAMHEVVEESHHSMMFHEFIRRSGLDPDDVPLLERWLDRYVVVPLARIFPELFFLCALSGEVFIDHDNREMLREPAAMQHPTLRRIVQVHVTEEARHVCFANAYLREQLPRASLWRRRAVRLLAGPILAKGAQEILQPTPAFVRRHGIPRAVLTEAFGRESAHAAKVRDVVAPIHALLRECSV
jgi:hypothetical protein